MKVHRDLLSIPPAVHGAIDYGELERYGIGLEEVVDFSENSNPFGPSPIVREAMMSANLARYPDRECWALRRALADHLACSVDEIVVGNGAAELIWLVGFAFMHPQARVLIVGPTFGEYARTAQLMGAQVIEWRAQQEDDFQLDLLALSVALQTHKPQIVFLCTPNNPTGFITPITTIEEWAVAHPQILFVIDEAYIDFVPDTPSAHTLGLPNVLTICSMTKAYALAGLRLGYALGPPSLIMPLSQARIPWSVNEVAQVAGIAALADQTYLQRTLTRLTTATQTLSAQLAEAGYPTVPSATHYKLIHVGNQHESASTFRSKLLPYGILVRDCASFGLPTYVRIAAKQERANERLISGVKKSSSGTA
ncbi:MAG: histidinol-phosphate transaminase [Chloroflexota bacterium]